VGDRGGLRHGRDPLADPKPLIRRVYAFVAYRIGAGADAEDVTAEALARAVRYRDSYDPALGAPVAWVIGIARRCIDDSLARPRTSGDPPDFASDLVLEDEAVQRLSLRAALRELPDRDRELVALRYGGDLTARQIGDQLGMHTNAVEVALHRALKRLRALLEEDVRVPTPSR
jgi:RNA polymerase sigma factor (sigma-70 family)